VTRSSCEHKFRFEAKYSGHLDRYTFRVIEQYKKAISRTTDGHTAPPMSNQKRFPMDSPHIKFEDLTATDAARSSRANSKAHTADIALCSVSAVTYYL
jgi:hypothetical protein